MVARPKPKFSADCRIAVEVIGPRPAWQTPEDYEAQVYRVAALVAEHRGPKAEYRNQRPGYVNHFTPRGDW